MEDLVGKEELSELEQHRQGQVKYPLSCVGTEYLLKTAQSPMGRNLIEYVHQIV